MKCSALALFWSWRLGVCTWQGYGEHSDEESSEHTFLWNHDCASTLPMCTYNLHLYRRQDYLMSIYVISFKKSLSFISRDYTWPSPEINPARNARQLKNGPEYVIWNKKNGALGALGGFLPPIISMLKAKDLAAREACITGAIVAYLLPTECGGSYKKKTDAVPSLEHLLDPSPSNCAKKYAPSPSEAQIWVHLRLVALGSLLAGNWKREKERERERKWRERENDERQNDEREWRERKRIKRERERERISRTRWQPGGGGKNKKCHLSGNAEVVPLSERPKKVVPVFESGKRSCQYLIITLKVAATIWC